MRAMRGPGNGPWHREQDRSENPKSKREKQDRGLPKVATQARDDRPETCNIISERVLKRSLASCRGEAYEWHCRCRDDAGGMASRHSQAHRDSQTQRESISKTGVHSVRKAFSRWRMANF